MAICNRFRVFYRGFTDQFSMQNIYIDSVAHRYGENQILNNVYLSCNVGETVGLLGRNGSGKSTLLKIMFGSITPDYMHMKLGDRIVTRAYLTGEVAYLPQDYFIPGQVKIKQLAGIYTNKYRAELLDLKLFSENGDNVLDDLSGGQRRLIELLLILYSDSTFILLDEPFSQLSPVLIEEMQKHLTKFKQRKGIILTDHYYQHTLETADRIVLLHNGCNYRIDSLEDLQLHGYITKMH
jgi:ABC-type multidrug transport system ATPase subunit